MNLWTSSETSGSIGESPMKFLLLIEDAFNNELSKYDYGSGIIELSYIAMIMVEKQDHYDEIKKYDKKKKEFEFRLKIAASRYRGSSRKGKIELLFSSILRAIKQIKEFNIEGFDTNKLIQDFTDLGVKEKWIDKETLI